MGEFPFSYENGKLALTLKPALPSWLFKNDGSLSFTFLGRIEVTYHNENMHNTWSTKTSHIDVHMSDGTKTTVRGQVISGKLAESVRDGTSVERINVYLI